MMEYSRRRWQLQPQHVFDAIYRIKKSCFAHVILNVIVKLYEALTMPEPVVKS